MRIRGIHLMGDRNDVEQKAGSSRTLAEKTKGQGLGTGDPDFGLKIAITPRCPIFSGMNLCQGRGGKGILTGQDSNLSGKTGVGLAIVPAINFLQ